jgi:hypothetical protein
MTNRQWIGRILIAIVVIAVLVGGGLTLYKFGYKQGLSYGGEKKAAFYVDRMGFMHDLGEGQVMPFHDQDGFRPNFEGGFPMPFQGGPGFPQGKGGGMYNGNGGGFGTPQRGFDRGFQNAGHYKSWGYFSSPLGWVVRLVVLGFFLWVAYVVVSRLFLSSGWQLSFKTVESSEKEKKSKKDKK